MEQDKLALRSVVVQEILSFVPHWMVRWGTAVIAMLLAILLLISWLIQYPDIIQGKGYLTALKQPITLSALHAGKVGSIYVQDNTLVKEHTPLIEIESELKEEMVVKLKKYIALIEEDLTNHYFVIKNYHLITNNYGNAWGEPIQHTYNTLQKYIQQYITSFQNDHYSSLCDHIKNSIKFTNSLVDIAEQQLTYVQEKVAQESIKYQNYKKLYQQHVASQLDYFNQKSLFLSAKEAVTHKQKLIVEYQIQLDNYQKQLREIAFKHHDDKQRLETAIYTTLQSLKNQIANWQQNYILHAPCMGQVCYLHDWSKHQPIKVGQELCVIVPMKEPYLIHLQVEAMGYGKIQKGQLARIKFLAYPDQEYGHLQGVVSEIAHMPHLSTYRVILLLNQGLVTNYGKKINFKPNMECIAEIVTNNRRLLQRILSKCFQSNS